MRELGFEVCISNNRMGMYHLCFNKEDNVFRAERDLKGLKAKIRGLDLSLNASSIKYFLYLYLHVYRAASHLVRSQPMLTGFYDF